MQLYVICFTVGNFNIVSNFNSVKSIFLQQQQKRVIAYNILGLQGNSPYRWKHVTFQYWFQDQK